MQCEGVGKDISNLHALGLGNAVYGRLLLPALLE
jgi:hypothetical protein